MATPTLAYIIVVNAMLRKASVAKYFNGLHYKYPGVLVKVMSFSEAGQATKKSCHAQQAKLCMPIQDKVRVHSDSGWADNSYIPHGHGQL